MAEIVKMLLGTPEGVFFLVLIAPFILLAAYAIDIRTKLRNPTAAKPIDHLHEIDHIRQEMNATFSALRSQIRALSKDISNLAERIARLE